MQRRPATIVYATAFAAFALLTVAVATGWQPLADLDRDLLADGGTMTDGRGWLVDASTVVSNVAHPQAFRVAAAVVALVLFLRARRSRLALFVVLAVGGGTLLSMGLKVAFGRRRPAEELRLADAAGYSY
nr:hypothetical protein [Micromonospora sp. DSM 115978]